MGSRTTFRDLYKPDKGEDNWSNEVNNNFDTVDEYLDGTKRKDVTSQSYTANPWEGLWVDTNSAGGNVTVTLPADSDVQDGERVEVGVEDASHDTDVVANTGQSIIGNNITLSNVGSTLTFEYKSSTSTWMVR